MLRDLAARAPALLQLQDAAVIHALQAELHGAASPASSLPDAADVPPAAAPRGAAGWRAELPALLTGDWHAQLIAAAALVFAGTDDNTGEAALVWQAIDAASWVAPQLIACAFLVDDAFVARTEERLLGVTRRPPKTLGALVRAYHRLPAPRLPVIARLSRHDSLLVSEEARVGIRGLDTWLDRLPTFAAPTARWHRLPR